MTGFEALDVRQDAEEMPWDVAHDVIDSMRKMGYPSTGRNPVNSIRSMLYRLPEFQCLNGRFYRRGYPSEKQASTRSVSGQTAA